MPSSEKKVTIAIAGNPNCGKTCLFNNLTGAHQRVGNWPGVTVEQKRGTFEYKGTQFDVIDLPGTYSLSSYSIEEEVVEHFVRETPPDVIVNIVDATNLERHLFLTAQLMETGVPILLALNMMDEAESLGLQIDTETLSAMLHIPVVPMVARRNKGTGQLLRQIIRSLKGPAGPAMRIDYGNEIEAIIDSLKSHLTEEETTLTDHARLVALLSGRLPMPADAENADLMRHVSDARDELKHHFRERVESIFAGHWYGFANGVARMCVKQSRQARYLLTEKLDNFLTHPILGLLIFGACMWLTFQIVFSLGAPLMDVLDSGISAFGTLIAGLLPDGFVKSLVVDGIIAGVGGVLVFLPNILLLFVAIGFLEDSGYMARAAFVMDGIMHRIGLHGKSFIPMLVGFGCTVPAVMATRSLDTKRDRLITALIVPFMSCGARLPVYTLFISAFFAKKYHAPLMLSIYILGILIAIIMANILGFIFFGRETTPLLLELPPYRLPTLRSVLTLTWMRAWMYLKKAGTILLFAAIIMWFLCSYPAMSDTAAKEYLVKNNSGNSELSEDMLHQVRFQNSYAGYLGRFIEPVIKPLGFDWKVGVGLITGLAAKEAVVSTLGIVYGVSNSDAKSEDLQNRLRQDAVFKDKPYSAYVLMVFVLLYIPCLAVVAVFMREFGLKWSAFLVFYTTAVAWIVAYIFRLAGMVFGLV